jgi:hypothetical protein
VTIKKPLQRFQLMNEICYNKVLDCAGKHQVRPVWGWWFGASAGVGRRQIRGAPS